MIEEMSPQERIEAAVALQPVDRVPVIPQLDWSVPRWKGLTIAEYMQHPTQETQLLGELWDEWGGWDAIYLVATAHPYNFVLLGTRVKQPGRELPRDVPPQIDEQELIQPEDYDSILQSGWQAFLMQNISRFEPSLTPEQLPSLMQSMQADVMAAYQYWVGRGVPVYLGPTPSVPPVEQLFFTRSLRAMITDLYRYPDKVKAVVERMTAETISTLIGMMDGVGSVLAIPPRAVFIGAARATMLAPKLFQTFFWPYLKQIVLALIDAGYIPNLHFDSNWTPFLEYFLELPKGKVVLQLDSATDIFKAKAVLKGHMCIMGDVPATLFALGTPEEVTAYCKKLIDVVGDGNGFILGSGCSVPYNAKKENVKAMIDTAKTYYPHRKRVF